MNQNNPLDKDVPNYTNQVTDALVVIGAWMVNSICTFIKMMGIMCLIFAGIAFFLGLVWGVPMFAMQSFEAGDYVYGWLGVLATALIYGGLFNQT